ncbi:MULTISPECIES: hypothetical protein [unclassified Mucilaginibacter]|uniref:hypothetical protein n=1 Tax=unclassified Mucilaginibacter TaxID=2617802 RepID=UPI002AC9387A|nr:MULTISPECIES: hypothetical protein [unclassified Mucilaginibacter]MEB0261707.1 hypothetical protein [Mucilaginibacter sp. 10I4]MEB0278357.1 hypothetical protein [Mucilaginibacter sp. 10B2]MEB0301022.1 hypothetical protein [Mucilaginibacter sp. 5C4]WPX24002.1 hypothetical protein RHM67_01760 [Mucilaginibacter sp. 5C4]
MAKAYQSIYVMFYRWNFKNFGQGSLPQFKSLFNVSFLLIVVLTNAMLFTKLMIKAQWLTLNTSTYIAILFGAVGFLLINHFILLNNRMLKSLNMRLATISAHNKNLFSVVLLINVVFACSLCLIR